MIGSWKTLLEEIVIHVNKEQEKDREKFVDKSTGVDMEQIAEPQSLSGLLRSTRNSALLLSSSPISPKKVHNLSKVSAASVVFCATRLTLPTWFPLTTTKMSSTPTMTISDGIVGSSEPRLTRARQVGEGRRRKGCIRKTEKLNYPWSWRLLAKDIRANLWRSFRAAYRWVYFLHLL